MHYGYDVCLASPEFTAFVKSVDETLLFVPMGEFQIELERSLIRRGTHPKIIDRIMFNYKMRSAYVC